MSKAKKVAILVASIAIAVGLIVSISVLAAVKFDFSKLNTMKYEINTYSIEADFQNIRIEGAECDIRLLPSEDETCRVICTEGDQISHTVTVNSDTLKIVREDRRKWYEQFGIYWGEMQIEVYLPQKTYEKLYVKSLSGNIEIPDDFTFSKAELQSMSGKIRCFASTEAALSIHSVSGDLYIGSLSSRDIEIQSTSGEVKGTSIDALNRVSVKTVSGEMELSNIKCKELTVDSTSGDMELSDIIAAWSIRAENTSGDIDLNRCDAESLWLKTTSGDICGSLLTDKMIHADTVSGEVSVPFLASGGMCEVKTTSGDIQIDILDADT